MPSTVRVCMRVCDKTCRITAVHGEDAISIELESDCSKLQQFGAELAKGVSMDDILDIYSSRITSSEVRKNVCFECLAVPAVFNACWLEEGMISKGLAKRSGSNSIEFDELRTARILLFKTLFFIYNSEHTARRDSTRVFPFTIITIITRPGEGANIRDRGQRCSDPVNDGSLIW